MYTRLHAYVISSVVVAVLCLMTSASALAYSAMLNAGVSDNEVKLGQRFTYTLIVNEEGDTNKQAHLLPPDFGVFAVEGSSRSAKSTVINGLARRETKMSFTLSADEPGEYTIGAATLRLTDPATGLGQDMTSNEVVVVVLDETPGVMDEIRDIKQPKTFFGHVKRVFYMVAGMVVLGLAVVLVLIYVIAKKYRHKKPSTIKPMPKMSARDAALAALGLASRLTADPREFYTAVTDALRRYLKEAHGIHSFEATTSELVGAAEKSGMQKGAVGELKTLFEEADLVKFAKYAPDEDGMKAYLERTRNFVRGV